MFPAVRDWSEAMWTTDRGMGMKFVVLSVSAVFGAVGVASAADPAQQAAPWTNAADESGRPANPLAAGVPPNASSRGAAVPGAAATSAQEEQSGTSRLAHASRPPLHSKTTKATKASSTQSASAAAGASPSSSSSDAGSDTSSETREQVSSASEDRSPTRNWSWLGLLGLFGLLGLLGRRRYAREPDAYERRSDDADVRGVRAYETPDPVARR